MTTADQARDEVVEAARLADPRTRPMNDPDHNPLGSAMTDHAYRASKGCTMLLIWAGIGFAGIVCLRGLWYLAGLVLGY